MSVRVTHSDEKGSWPIETRHEPLQMQGIRCRRSWLSLNHQAPAGFTGEGPSAQSPSGTGGRKAERRGGGAIRQCQVSAPLGQIPYLQTGTNHQLETPGLPEKLELRLDV